LQGFISCQPGHSPLLSPKDIVNSAWSFVKHIVMAEMSSECVYISVNVWLQKEKKDPIIPVKVVVQHTPTSAYIRALSGLTWETCYFESSCIP
jgi:hypothetical protein